MKTIFFFVAFFHSSVQFVLATSTCVCIATWKLIFFHCTMFAAWIHWTFRYLFLIFRLFPFHTVSLVRFEIRIRFDFSAVDLMLSHFISLELFHWHSFLVVYDCRALYFSHRSNWPIRILQLEYNGNWNGTSGSIQSALARATPNSLELSDRLKK